MSINVDMSVFASVLRLDFSLRNIIAITRYLSQFKIVFTIIGPAYLVLLSNTKHVCGFAHPWICFKEHTKDAFEYVMRRPSNKNRTEACLNLLEPGWCSND